MKLYWLKEEDILAQIINEYEYWFNHIESKRAIRRNDLDLYVKESQQDRVDIHSIYTTVQTLMAINYLNEIQVEFTKRKEWDEEIATNTNIVAEFDYTEMWLDVKDYIWEFNRLSTWVWIQTAWPFDFTSIHPTIDNIDTLSFIFDPKWWPTIDDHRFFGIETEMTMSEMKDAWFENYENIQQIWQTIQTNEANLDQVRWQGYTEDFTENKKYSVYIHWMIIKKQKYISVSSWEWKILLSFKRMEPVLEEEKKDPTKIKFPIAFKYFSYVPGDSMWVSPFDLLRSKQNAYSILFNLMLQMAYKNAMGWDRLINTKYIKDLTSIAVPTLEWKDIPISLEPGENIWNVIDYVQKDQPTNIPIELRDWLAQETILDTWIDRNTQWVLATSNNTLGEREMAQKNANLRFLLWSKQAMWWEIFRWKYLWYRQYAANLKSVDKKEFALETWYSEDFHAFKKDDFIGWDMLHLNLKSKAEVELEMEKMKNDRIARYPQEIAEAQMEWQNWKILKIQRNRMRDVWEPEQRVMTMYPYSVDELNAMDKMAILKLAISKKQDENGDIAKEGLRIDNFDETHEVFIEMFQTLPDNPIKRKAISMRYDAIKQAKDIAMQQAQLQGMSWGWQWLSPIIWWWGWQTSWPTNTAANVATAQASANQLNPTGSKVPDANING